MLKRPDWPLVTPTSSRAFYLIKRPCFFGLISGKSGFEHLFGFFSVLGGNTPYEIRKNIRYEEVDTVPKKEKFRQVFGTCGILHFFIPFVPFDGESAVFTLKNYDLGHAQRG